MQFLDTNVILRYLTQDDPVRAPEIMSYDGDFDAIPGITRHAP